MFSIKKPKKIGEILIEMGLITDAQFEEALAIGKKSGKRIGRILIDSGLVTEEAIAQALSIQLTAILYSSKEPTAVINKKIVKINDYIGNQKIVDIKKDYVILQHDRRSFRLELVDLIKNPNDIKAMR